MARVHVTEPPVTIIYARVVYREKIRIALTLTTLDDFPVKVEDIQNAYIMALVAEEIRTVLGPEFGEGSGRKTTVVSPF